MYSLSPASVATCLVRPLSPITASTISSITSGLFGLVALRLAYPDVVVDLNRAAGLHGVRDEGDHLVIGAMTTHYEVIRSELVRRHCGQSTGQVRQDRSPSPST